MARKQRIGFRQDDTLWLEQIQTRGSHPLTTPRRQAKTVAGSEHVGAFVIEPVGEPNALAVVARRLATGQSVMSTREVADELKMGGFSFDKRLRLTVRRFRAETPPGAERHQDLDRFCLRDRLRSKKRCQSVKTFGPLARAIPIASTMKTSSPDTGVTGIENSTAACMTGSVS
jgi:hypothetical protein